MKRLFLALTLEPDLAARLARVAPGLEPECGALTPYSAEDLHLTLSFLGEIEDEHVAGVIRSAAEEFRGLWAPELELTGELELLPIGAETPSALAAVVSEVGDRQGRLGALRNRAQQVGLSRRCPGHRADRRREYRPHVTLAQLLDGPPAPLGDLDSGITRQWLGGEIALFESPPRSAPGSPRYRQLMSWGLAVDPG
ncbi:MAG: 2'-5' RNA ligase family protein [Planctomycetota bacterium]|nr:2'-5' RNA ligase family protein [Planctomycetota bacterium]